MAHGVCLTRGTVVPLRMEQGEAVAWLTTLADFARDNSEDGEIVAQVAALAPGQSVRLGGGAATPITVTRLAAEEALPLMVTEVARDASEAPLQVVEQAWEALHEVVLRAARAHGGVDADYAAAYLRRHQRRILPRLGLVEVTAAAADLVVLAAATARQRITLEPGIHPRAVVVSALAAMATWLENRPRIDVQGADLRAQVR